MASFPNVTVRDRSVLFEDESTLVLADVHLGRVRESDVDLPLGEPEDVHDRLKTRLRVDEPDRVVVAGDLVHAFGTIPYEVAETVRTFAATVRNAGAELIVTEGNHDTALDTVDAIDPVSQYRLSEATVIHHGHEIPNETATRYVIGHDHPAITIEGTRRPCVLDCDDQYEGAAVLVLPAFNRAAIGTLVNGRTATDTMSSLLTDFDRCRPIVSTDDGPLRFPPLETLRGYL